MLIVSNNLKKIRENKGITQREIAKRVNIRLANYVYIEQGKSEPKLKTALLIAEALQEPVDKLFSLKSSRNDR